MDGRQRFVTTVANEDMRTVSQRILLIVAILAITLSASPHAARADSSGQIPLKFLSRMAVDTAHRHLFMTGQLDSGSGVLAVDYSGAVVSTIDTGPSSSGLAVNQKAGRLYVGSGGTIYVIDTATLQIKKSYVLSAPGASDIQVFDLLQIGTNVWFAAQWMCNGYVCPGLGLLKLKTGKVVLYHGSDFPSGLSARFAGDPANRNVFVVASDIYLYEYDVSSGHPSLLVTRSGYDTTDIGITGDGKDLLLTLQNDQNVTALKMSDFSSDGSYPGDGTHLASAVAASADGSSVALGLCASSGDTPDIFVFPTGSQKIKQSLTTGSAYHCISPGGLRFAAHDTMLFAVNGESGGDLSLDEFDGPTLSTSSLTLTAPASAPPGSTVELSGSLTFADGSSAAGQTIHVYETPPGGSEQEIGSPVTDADGAYEATTPPLQDVGTYQFDAVFDGDQGHKGSSAAADTLVVANGKIVFDSNRTGNYEIFTLNADGSGIKQLTNNPADDFDPAWSHDGSKIAFTSDRSGTYDVWTMNADGTGLKRVAASTKFDGDPSWSPDGSTLAFESDRTGPMEIWTVDLNTGTPRQYTFKGTVNEYPSWSPDGSKIAFDSNRSGNFDVYTINADGSGVQDKTNNAASDGGASWSPDGHLIAFGSDRTGDVEIWTLNVETGDLTQLTHVAGFDGDQSYAPDGSMVAFTSTRAPQYQVWVMHADGSNPVRYTKTGTINEYADWGTNTTILGPHAPVKRTPAARSIVARPDSHTWMTTERPRVAPSARN